MSARLEARAARVAAALKKLYPDAAVELDYRTPLDLLVATILSAQCMDKRVNVVTKGLFARFKAAGDYAQADPAELEGMIRSTGFFRAKAASIQAAARTLVAEFGGEVPDTMEGLLKLKGVGRKTANVILGSVFGKAEGIVVDTHMKRVAFRLGLTESKDPEEIERDLMALVPRKGWIFFSQGMVWHGRRVCRAVGPECPSCALDKLCPKRVC
ncbi:MAG: endonuclease III [Elusimicrobia bacterium]|nr:endonuclease III [Elusimicrobiota bacterium]